MVGAKTVKGPAPESVSTRPPALSAVTSVERSGVATARSTIVLPLVLLCCACAVTARSARSSFHHAADICAQTSACQSSVVVTVVSVPPPAGILR